ncbi:MAG: glycosyltransferase [Bacteroidetes bacterium]|nr:MAG: glycosyltransferase [Bacteroidota bacterium]
MGTPHQFVKLLSPCGDSATPRPLISVMIPTFNCATYLRTALASVLEQDMGSNLMQIEVVDDCSTDDPEAVANELGNGRVHFYRQVQNGGHTKNFETCMNRAKGKYLHLLHGDDKVEPGFYATLLPMLEANEAVGAAFCANQVIDEYDKVFKSSVQVAPMAGVVNNFFKLMLQRQWVQTPSIIVRRSVYETIGMFDSRLAWCEDWEMWTRIAAHYAVAYSPKALASYRVHTKSNTSRHVKSGENLRDLKRFKTIVQDYVDAGDRKWFIRHMNNKVAKSAFNAARTFYAAGDKMSAKQQLLEALYLDTDLRIKLRLIGLYLKKK